MEVEIERKNPHLDVKHSCFIRDADAKVRAGEVEKVLLVTFSGSSALSKAREYID